MPNPENVRGKGNRWKKGESGNPKGRPKLPSMKAIMLKVLGDMREGKTAAEAVMIAMRSKALKGDVRAAEFLIERAYGKVTDNIDLQGSANIVIMPSPPGEESTPPQIDEEDEEVED